MSLASEWFDAKRAESKTEDAICAALDEVGIVVWDNPRSDPYDESLELDDCPADMRLTVDQQAAIWAMGFARIWLNHVDGMETYYHPKYPDGSRKHRIHRRHAAKEPTP